eukprot:5011372-Prymnesium_polylepis.1
MNLVHAVPRPFNSRAARCGGNRPPREPHRSNSILRVQSSCASEASATACGACDMDTGVHDLC